MISRLLLAVALLCAVSYGQVMVSPILQPHNTFVDQSGAPCAGCSLFSYTAGSTIPTATYQDAGGGVPNTNPIILSVQGGANIWVDTSIAYKFVLKNTQGTTLWSVDNVKPATGPPGPPGVSLGISVTTLGAVGDGVHDDTSAIQAGLNQVASSSGRLIFPCGTYIVSAPLVLTVAPSQHQAGSLAGENTACSIIRYTGTTAGPILTVTTGTPGAYFSGFSLQNLTFLGNGNTTDDVLLVRPNHFDVTNLFAWGANSTTGDCLQIQEGIGGKLDTFACTGLITSVSLPAPNVGLLLTGVNGTDQTGAMSILNPIIELVKGPGVKFVNSSLIFMSGCQTAGNGQGLLLDDTSFKNTISNCLFENSPQASHVGGNNNVVDNSTFSYFAGNTTNIDLEIGGRQNTVSNVLVQWGLSVLSTATFANLSNDIFGANPTDAGQGTKITNSTFGNPGSAPFFPQGINNTYTTPGFSGAGVTATETMTGSWVFSSSVPNIMSPTVFPTGKSWRAIFVGKFGGSGSVAALEGMPVLTEITESANTITMPSTATLTFAVNGGGLFTATGGSGAETFNGTIIFLSDTTAATSGANSARFTGTINAPLSGSFNGTVGAITPNTGAFTSLVSPTIQSFALPATGFNRPISILGGTNAILYMPSSSGSAGTCFGGSVVGGDDGVGSGGVVIRAQSPGSAICGSETYENTLGVFHSGVNSLVKITAPGIQATGLSGTGNKAACLDPNGNLYRAAGTSCP